MDRFSKIWQKELVNFIDENYPKGNKARIYMAVKIAVFMLKLEKRLKKCQK